MDIRPVDLPELQAEMLSHYSLPTTLEAWRVMADRQMFTLPGKGETFLAEEMRRLRRESYWVAQEMVALACAAAPSMPSFTVNEPDLPSLFGFMYFDAPIGSVDTPMYDGGTMPVPVVACSWGPISGRDGTAVWLSIYTENRTPEQMCRDFPGMNMSEAVRVRAQMPRLGYENETLIPFGHDWASFASNSSFLSTLGRTIRAVWSLMQQPLATCSEVDLDRAVRKRLRRSGTEPGPVRVVKLRRPAHSACHGDGDREYHHQWVVRGHWRQQWYPAREVHRPVWIAPHIKGPEGAPLIGGEKVYAWKR
ncbi:hypothetical protein QMK19_03585 [Streptomyces sp. H10-C2]|uniref:hypothetical protein n=1 Tax=unclassified Streptomyces TaxID=2593676 RepID=UPI0024B9E800|nr:MULTISPECIES: hypothetical protein [unclassified Streptomyces]MDJ0342269.1 hypothetical protein [Streptomyces sp. PH10-H1]MDJ0368783.1 hypothetical protein [Streptomyces sp. H10-C2]